MNRFLRRIFFEQKLITWRTSYDIIRLDNIQAQTISLRSNSFMRIRFNPICILWTFVSLFMLRRKTCKIVFLSAFVQRNPNMALEFTNHIIYLVVSFVQLWPIMIPLCKFRAPVYGHLSKKKQQKRNTSGLVKNTRVSIIHK